MRQDDKGYTVIELLVVAIITFIITSIIVSAFLGDRRIKYQECYEQYQDAIHCEIKVNNGW